MRVLKALALIGVMTNWTEGPCGSLRQASFPEIAERAPMNFGEGSIHETALKNHYFYAVNDIPIDVIFGKCGEPRVREPLHNAP
jgi:hypothetical protein